LHERLARLVDELGAPRLGEVGLSCVGAVTGATRPDHLGRLRELMPRAIFLLPGVGAQGGRVEELGPAFAPHPAAGLVTASRSIVNARAERGGDSAAAAQAAAEELRAASWNL
jgi:orotidine-5'-phosphate decarboxylase